VFLLYDLHDRSAGRNVVHDLAAYLNRVNWRRGTLFIETRVFTCRSWRATGGATQRYDLHWNSNEVAGEIFLGEIGMTGARAEVVARVAEVLACGEAVRTFGFNRDSDVCIEEVLVPDA
jgi:hypothetical protein